jgi:hypothetical protein
VRELSRWSYLLSLANWWWGAIVAIQGLYGLYELICGQFVDDAPRLGEIMPWYALSLGLLAILLGVTLEKSYRQHRRLVVSPHDSVVSELARESYRVGGARKSGDELFLELAPEFREPIRERSLASYLYEKICEFNETKLGTAPISGEEAHLMSQSGASRILGNWFALGLLDTETIDPAPGATSNIRTSQHDFPYSVYRLSADGKAVFQCLKKRFQPYRT